MVDEIVDTVDALGLATASLLSISTANLFPAPAEVPDRQRVEQFLNLLNVFLSSRATSGASSAGRRSSQAGGLPMSSFSLTTLRSIIERISNLLRNPARIQQSGPLLMRLNTLATEVKRDVSLTTRVLTFFCRVGAIKVD